MSVLADGAHSDRQQSLHLLATTPDGNLCDLIALELSDREVPQLFPIVVDLQRDERTSRRRGTLLPALAPYDCSSILPLLVDLFVTGVHEVRLEAFNRLIETEAELPSEVG